MSTPAQHSDRPRVVIVDADRRVQHSLRDVLRVAGGVDVVGTAGDVRRALEMIERQRPDVVIVDPRLPDLDAGAALVRSIGLAWPTIRIVATGWAFDMPDVSGHAVCFVAKSAQPEEFVAAVVSACSEAPLTVIPEAAPSGP
jgi:DNA-binding NarL/FixJ family response regulator